VVILENYKKAIEQFAITNGNNRPVVLFAALKMDELIDKWSILLSIEWTDDADRKKIFTDLIAAMQQHLTAEELSEIARIVFYKPDEHLVELFFSQFREGQYIKDDARVNGNVIHEGYIIILRKPSESDPNQASLL
jgi:hypothetical protein